MVTEREITQIGGAFLTERLKGAIRLGYVSASLLGIFMLILGVGVLHARAQAETNGRGS